MLTKNKILIDWLKLYRNFPSRSIMPHSVGSALNNLLLFLLSAIFLISVTPFPFSLLSPLCHPYKFSLVFLSHFFPLIVLILSTLIPYPLIFIHVQTILTVLFAVFLLYEIALNLSLVFPFVTPRRLVFPTIPWKSWVLKFWSLPFLFFLWLTCMCEVLYYSWPFKYIGL